MSIGAWSEYGSCARRSCLFKNSICPIHPRIRSAEESRSFNGIQLKQAKGLFHTYLDKATSQLLVQLVT